MSFRSLAGRQILAAGLAFGLFVGTVSGALAHARYDHADPDVSVALDGAPFVLRAYFTQELMKASTMSVVDASGTQVDVGDGHVDVDDPDRKVMLVSLPELQPGLYTVQWTTVSAEDGDTEDGTFAFGVGMTPPTGQAPVDGTTFGS